ncbi:MAG: hypothetical protein ACXVCP_03195 [Bdellovibrio sp.]
MSDNTLEQQQPKQTQDSSTEKKESSRKSLFGRNLNLNQDLKNALNSWDSVTESVQNKVSPVQEQMTEVKKLLVELKSKLSEFE